ncbi:MAG: type I restriction endonuclease subunit R [Ktedonobacteraceae bacterium]|nr:type I restriction endonuclease subunit R [Ktedonobacteraceae bacterium]
MNENSEDLLVERPAVELFEMLDYECINAYNARTNVYKLLGRENKSEVVLVPRLRKALQELNPGLPPQAIELAIEELTRDRSVMTLVAANRQVYRLLKDGVPVDVLDDEGGESRVLVRVIEWDQDRLENNDFLCVSQFGVTGSVYDRRPDVVGFVNGIPLVLCEFKAPRYDVKDAFNDNITDYKDTIPQLFWYNAFIIISNGSKSLVGSFTADFEHFFEWKRIESEDEAGGISLEIMLRGMCDKRRLLDIVENFTLFSDAGGALLKIIAKNHQYLGVNNALEAVHGIRNNRGRLGVFWHTQGSGKTFSMIFFSQKVQRKMPGNWTFVVVTDGKDLDKQTYHSFVNAGVVSEVPEEVWAKDGEHLKRLLRADHSIVFTLIQKFRTDKGKEYPELSPRSDIIVMTDEAHRNQYDIFAANMRKALPNASFIGFTGTPLIQGEEEETRRVFGDYVSVYNFRRSVEDGTTVPLYYENRIPELQLTNEELNAELERLVDDAGLDEAQERVLERQVVQESRLITNNDRLERIAEDIVAHFMARVQAGDYTADKAMVISNDKITTVRMHDKVKKYWQRYSDTLQMQLEACTDEAEREVLAHKIGYMRESDMAVVISQEQNEVKDFRERGLDIMPHRRRIKYGKLDEKFKNPNDKLRIVFVCAMWMTGFDVPCLSTIYLDKPMRNHGLMQSIARANRIFQDKANGLIVDYVGVFRNLQEALAIYGAASGGGIREGDTPVQDKEALAAELKYAVTETIVFCQQQGIDPDAIALAQGIRRIPLLDAAENALLANDETKKKYLCLARHVAKLYKAVLPHPTATHYASLVGVFAHLVIRIHEHMRPPPIGEVVRAADRIIAESITTRGYIIHPSAPNYDASDYIDLSKIDLEALREKFASTPYKNTELEKLRGAIESKLDKMVKLNKRRTNYQEKFQQLIDDYNSGSRNTQMQFEELMRFAQELSVEEQRHIAERLSEEELATFDLLRQPGIVFSDKQLLTIKKAVSEMLATLKREKLVLDWRKKQQAQAGVKKTIRDVLRANLPLNYTKELLDQAFQAVYQHIYDSYYGQGKSIYADAG